MVVDVLSSVGAVVVATGGNVVVTTVGVAVGVDVAVGARDASSAVASSADCAFVCTLKAEPCMRYAANGQLCVSPCARV